METVIIRQTIVFEYNILRIPINKICSLLTHPNYTTVTPCQETASLRLIWHVRAESNTLFSSQFMNTLVFSVVWAGLFTSDSLSPPIQSSTSPTPPPSLPPTQSPTSPPACCPFGVKGYCKQVWLGEEPQVGLLHNCNGTRATCTGKLFTCDMNNDNFEFDICFFGPSMVFITHG